MEPRGAAGAVAEIEVSELNVKVVAGRAPKETEVTPVNPDPVIWTFAPVIPHTGLMLVTTGRTRTAATDGGACAWKSFAGE